jgi:hypothetical protein
MIIQLVNLDNYGLVQWLLGHYTGMIQLKPNVVEIVIFPLRHAGRVGG